MRNTPFPVSPILLALGTLLAGSLHAQVLNYQPPIALIAGQNTTIGQVACGIDAKNDSQGACRANTTGGWCLVRAHLYVGSFAPVSLAPGQFPFQAEPGQCVTELTMPFQADRSCVDKPLIVAFHAEARLPSSGREETAWVQGTQTGSNWSMTFGLACRQIDN